MRKEYESLTSRVLRDFPNASITLTMCCFLLAEARKKQKTFFSHTSGSLGASVQGV